MTTARARRARTHRPRVIARSALLKDDGSSTRTRSPRSPPREPPSASGRKARRSPERKASPEEKNARGEKGPPPRPRPRPRPRRRPRRRRARRRFGALPPSASVPPPRGHPRDSRRGGFDRGASAGTTAGDEREAVWMAAALRWRRGRRRVRRRARVPRDGSGREGTSQQHPHRASIPHLDPRPPGPVRVRAAPPRSALGAGAGGGVAAAAADAAILALALEAEGAPLDALAVPPSVSEATTARLAAALAPEAARGDGASVDASPRRSVRRRAATPRGGGPSVAREEARRPGRGGGDHPGFGRESSGKDDVGETESGAASGDGPGPGLAARPRLAAVPAFSAFSFPILAARARAALRRHGHGRVLRPGDADQPPDTPGSALPLQSSGSTCCARRRARRPPPRERGRRPAGRRRRASGGDRTRLGSPPRVARARGDRALAADAFYGVRVPAAPREPGLAAVRRGRSSPTPGAGGRGASPRRSPGRRRRTSEDRGRGGSSASNARRALEVAHAPRGEARGGRPRRRVLREGARDGEAPGVPEAWWRAPRTGAAPSRRSPRRGGAPASASDVVARCVEAHLTQPLFLAGTASGSLVVAVRPESAGDGASPPRTSTLASSTNPRARARGTPRFVRRVGLLAARGRRGRRRGRSRSGARTHPRRARRRRRACRPPPRSAGRAWRRRRFSPGGRRRRRVAAGARGRRRERRRVRRRVGHARAAPVRARGGRRRARGRRHRARRPRRKDGTAATPGHSAGAAPWPVIATGGGP